MKHRLGAATSQDPSPLPQGAAKGGAQSVRIVDAFYQQLPGKMAIFFQRAYFAQYPRPVGMGGLPGFPRPVQVARIEVPKQQGLIITNVGYRVYEHSGIDVDDVIEVSPSRTTTVFGFTTAIGNRGMTDFNTNVTARGDVINWQTGKPGTTAAFPPMPGQGSFFPFAGSSQQGLEKFAYYARPGQTIDATVQILRLPPYDTRLFSVEISGYLLPEVMLDKLLDALSGTPGC